MTALTILLKAAQKDLAAYASLQWRRFQLAKHHELIVDRLHALETGKIRRLMIFLPPRHGKSLLTTLMFPAYYLGRHPDRSIISAAYGQDLADDFGRRVRNTVSDPRHQEVFPACKLMEDASSMRRFGTTAGGSYFAVGRGGSITGRGADLIIIDDPIKDREEAQSETLRRSLYEWFCSVAYTRLQPGGAICIVQTRWHEADLAGMLLSNNPREWEVLSLPAIAETDEEFRRAGEALWPKHFPLPALETIRAVVGGSAWASLYQQRPAAAEGTVFKREWWRSYEQPPPFTRVVQSWDTAFKTGSDNDFSVCTTWGVATVGYFLLGFWRGRVEFPELKKQMAEQAKVWRPAQILVEDQASGQSLIQELKWQTALPIVAIRPDRDKLSRAQAVTPMIEAGKVYLPQGTSWRHQFIDELASFPTGVHDDVVDSTTQALNYIHHPQETHGWSVFPVYL